ncbi:hypothetical protein [Tenacibaculum halocynthiae]|uniref:hypothetical protein n=1 Tax=Tenacibaculum halocynthiae TaxID=1254437 RepID=UPI003D64B3FA
MRFLKKIKEFVHVVYTTKQYEAVIIYNDEKISIKNSENIFSISPFKYGFYFDKFNLDFKKNQEIQLQYYSNEVLISSNIITYLSRNKQLYIFEIKETNLSTLNSFKFWFYYYYNYCKNLGKMETTFSVQKTIASIYATPRKVYICSFTSLNGNHILFPIDLVIENKNQDTFFYSIRKSNSAVKEIIKKKKATIIYSQFNNRKNILELGKYHSITFPKLSKLNFKTTESKVFKHPIPDFLEHYVEIENIEEIDLEDQTLFMGRVLFKKLPPKNYKELANIYFLFKNN